MKTIKKLFFARPLNLLGLVAVRLSVFLASFSTKSLVSILRSWCGGTVSHPCTADETGYYS
ncbi:hypothetical protein U1Q18_009582, partial [Sarracenia purpurea var. burkii]